MMCGKMRETGNKLGPGTSQQWQEWWEMIVYALLRRVHAMMLPLTVLLLPNGIFGDLLQTILKTLF